MSKHGLSLAAQGLALPPIRGSVSAATTALAAPGSMIAPGLGRILRPQAAYRWLLPQIAAITPQYIEMTLRGALAGNHVQAWELFDLMLDSWPELASVAGELVEGVQKKKLVFEPFCEEDEQPTPEAIRRSKTVSSALRRMRPTPDADENDLNGTIKDILSGWFLGQAVLEIDWHLINTSSGQIWAPKSTYWVHPVCFAWDMSGRLGLRNELATLNTQESAKRGELTSPWNSVTAQPMPTSITPFPEHKFLIGIHKAKSGTALGGALLRPLAWWWCAANFSADWLLNLAQVFGLPFRWANYDPNAPQATIDTICSMLQNMGSAAWAAFPAGTTLELKDAGKSGDATPQGDLLDRADRYARTLILGQTLTGANTSAKGGGLAFGETESGVKGDRIDAAAKYAASVINLQLIPSILILNYGDDEEAPEIRFLEDSEGGVTDAQRDTILAGGGLEIGVNYLRSKYNIPAPQDDEETIGGAAEPADPASMPDMPDPADPSAPENPVEDADPLAAKDTTPVPDPTPADKACLCAAIASEFQSLNARLAAIADITDPELQHQKLSAVLADLDAFERNLHHDPAVATAIYKILSAGFANGVAQANDNE